MQRLFSPAFANAVTLLQQRQERIIHWSEMASNKMALEQSIQYVSRFICPSCFPVALSVIFQIYFCFGHEIFFSGVTLFHQPQNYSKGGPRETSQQFHDEVLEMQKHPTQQLDGLGEPP